MFNSIFPDTLVIDTQDLCEVILDLGKCVRYRYFNREVKIPVIVDEFMLKHVETAINDCKFNKNRSGIDGTLHRISRIVGNKGNTIGFTCRYGRYIEGCAKCIYEYIDRGDSILLIGKPGSGKTTQLRDVARYSAGKKMTMIVDTSSEIAGAGDIAHSSIGDARRIPVIFNHTLAETMIEAVENHTPEVLVVDELSNIHDVNAVRSIAQRGVQLIATVHGDTLHDVVKNPVMSKLLGGIDTVTISDIEARRRESGKNILEREYEPTFSVVGELKNFDTVHVYSNIKVSIDAITQEELVLPEIRKLVNGQVEIIQNMRIIARTGVREIA